MTTLSITIDGARLNRTLAELGRIGETPQGMMRLACPDCGKEIVWAEAGHVPGWRQCIGCEKDYITDMYGVVQPEYAVITCQGCGYGLPAGMSRDADCPVCAYDALR